MSLIKDILVGEVNEMKKKFLIFLCLFFSFTLFVEAKEIEISNKIIEFVKIDDFDLQGFTVVNDSLFIVLVNDDETKSLVKVFNLENMQEIYNLNFGSLGHANDVTYNKRTNKIYVLAGSGSNKVYVFNGSNFKYEECLEVNFLPRSITYIEEMNKYAVRLVTSGFLVNSEWEFDSKWPFITGMNLRKDVGRQGWAYYNGYIYYANWSWIRMGGNGTNNVMVYNLNGEKVDELLTTNQLGELEDIAFYGNKMILGFNCYDNRISFYWEEVPEIEISKNLEELKNDSEVSKDIIQYEKTNYFYLLPIIVLVLICFLLKKLIFDKAEKK